MQLRSAPQGPLFQGLARGDILTWDDDTATWTVARGSPVGKFSTERNGNVVVGTSPGVSNDLGSAFLNVEANSQIKIEAAANGQGSVAPGFAFIHTDAAAFPELAGVAYSHSFNTAAGTDRRSLNYLGVTDPIAVSGVVEVKIQFDVNGGGGATFTTFGVVICLTEIREL